MKIPKHDAIFLFGTKVCDIEYPEDHDFFSNPPIIQYTKGWVEKGFPLDAALAFTTEPQPGFHRTFFTDIAPGFVEFNDFYKYGDYYARKIYAVPAEIRQGAIEFASDAERNYPPIPSWKDFLRFAHNPDISQKNPFLEYLRSPYNTRKIISFKKGKDLYLSKTMEKIQVANANMALWGKVMYDMAHFSGIRTPKNWLICMKGRRHSLIAKRFDRRNGKKIHYASAFTLLGEYDGVRYGYHDLNLFIRRFGNNDDLPELWRRMAFNAIAKNTDDHLHNHGFLRIDGKWRLAPAFDIEPPASPLDTSHALALNTQGLVDVNDKYLPEILLQEAESYDVSLQNAKREIEEICEVVSHWSDIADQYEALDAEKKRLERIWASKDKGKEEAAVLRM